MDLLFLHEPEDTVNIHILACITVFAELCTKKGMFRGFLQKNIKATCIIRQHILVLYILSWIVHKH